VIRWSCESGRLFQIPELFMSGMLAGRKGIFKAPAFWLRSLALAVLAFIPFYCLKTWPEAWNVASAATSTTGDLYFVVEPGVYGDTGICVCNDVLFSALVIGIFSIGTNEFKQLFNATDYRYVDLLWIWTGHVSVHGRQFRVGPRD
jgi:hypothetical protein